MAGDFRLTIQVQCACAAQTHEAIVYRTAVPGLVVGHWVHTSSTRDAKVDKDRWVIYHHATGLTLPLDYGDPETAQAAAIAIGSHWDWERVAKPCADIQLATYKILRRYSDGEYQYGGTGEIRAVNA